LDALEFLGLVLGIVRGVAWLFRSIGRAISAWF
jgi:hypothetical protein